MPNKIFRNYIFKVKETSVIKTAEELAISRQAVYNLLNGKPAGRELAERIEVWSEGSVNRQVMLYPN